LQKLKNMIGEEREECRFYLTENDWDIVKALNHWQRDVKWERGVIQDAIPPGVQASQIVVPESIIVAFSVETKNLTVDNCHGGQPSGTSNDEGKPLLGTTIHYV